jgi:hypothetical protein
MSVEPLGRWATEAADSERRAVSPTCSWRIDAGHRKQVAPSSADGGWGDAGAPVFGSQRFRQEKCVRCVRCVLCSVWRVRCVQAGTGCVQEFVRMRPGNGGESCLRMLRIRVISRSRQMPSG